MNRFLEVRMKSTTFILVIMVLMFKIVSSTHYDPNQTALEMALEQLDKVVSRCILIVDATVTGGHVEFEGLSVPLILLTPESLVKKHQAFSLCSSILVSIDKPGGWLNWLPVEHKIIFIMKDINWILNYPRLTRLKKSYYYHTQQVEDVYHIDRYERKPFSGELRKVPLMEVNRLLATECEDKVMSDYGGIELKGVAFNLSPFSVLNFDESKGHDGYEVNIVSTIAKALNLNMIIKTPSTGGWWGSPDKNGNYSGMTGDLQHAVADVGWGNVIITPFRMLIMDFTDWYLVDPTCFIYKRANPYAGVFSLIFPLEKETWLSILMMLVGVNLFYLAYSMIWNDNTLTFSNLFLYETSVAFKVSHDMTHSLPTITLKFFTVTFLLVMTVLTAAYSGALISFFSVEVYPSPPQTVEDLAKIVKDDNLKVQTCCGHMMAVMRASNMESFKIITEPEREVKWIEGHFKEAMLATSEGKRIYVHTRNRLEILRRQNAHIIPYGQVAIMRECFFPNRIAFGLSQNSPFKTSFDLKLAQLKQAGLIYKMMSDGLDMVRRVHVESPAVDIKVNGNVLELLKMQGIFQVWSAVLILASLAFLVEMARGLYLKRIKGKNTIIPSK